MDKAIKINNNLITNITVIGKIFIINNGIKINNNIKEIPVQTNKYTCTFIKK